VFTANTQLHAANATTSALSEELAAVREELADTQDAFCGLYQGTTCCLLLEQNTALSDAHTAAALLVAAATAEVSATNTEVSDMQHGLEQFVLHAAAQLDALLHAVAAYIKTAWNCAKLTHRRLLCEASYKKRAHRCSSSRRLDPNVF